jgi:multisubunit Na+/H+ antiporter MnhB subunit
MQIPGALPDFLKVWWVCASPFAVLFAGRILWEKTILTWSQGPQMVGFALWHIHPGLALVGTLSSLAVALWLLITIPYATMRRRDIEPPDWLMMACSVLVIVALTLPDTFFA